MCTKPFSKTKNKGKLFLVAKSSGPLLARMPLNFRYLARATCKAAATWAIFSLQWWCDFVLKIVASSARDGGHTTRQIPWFCRKKFNSLKFSRFVSAIFSAIASPVRGWLHMRFLPRTGVATLKKITSSLQAKKKNRSYSRGLMEIWIHSADAWILATSCVT